MLTVEVTILVGKRTSFARLRMSESDPLHQFEDAFFAALDAEPAVVDYCFVGLTDDTLSIDHDENVLVDKLAEPFFAAGAKTGTTVTVKTV